MSTAVERHIEVNASVRGGKPCIVGTRIAVSDVVLVHFRLGQSLEQIAGHYALSLAALHAAMAYYYDHQAEIDKAVQEEDAFLRAAKNKGGSLLQTRINAKRGA